jgi:hypothetical protein
MRVFPVILMMLLVPVAAIFTGCSDDDEAPMEPPPPTSLKVSAVGSAPVIDGVVDPIWSSATAFVVRVGTSATYQNAFGPIDVTMKAISYNNKLYVLAQWADATLNVQKKTWMNAAGAWSQGSGDEDRFFMMFDAGNNGTERADCSTMCHQPVAGQMATTGGGNVDVWHWKAARTNPGNRADDKWWDGSGRNSDSRNASLYTDNIENVGGMDRPMFMHTDSTDYTGDFLFEMDKVAFDPSFNWDGKMIPFYVIDPSATGSRWDVVAKGLHASGAWTLELCRDFDTTNGDDVVLGSGSVQISVAITDDSGGNHSGAAPFLLEF